MEIRHKDWHINQKILPDVGSAEYDDYYDYHEELCKKGCWVDGVYINGYLYWHLNFWNTDVDFPNPDGGKPIQRYTNPILRDNEWEIFNAIEKAEKEGKGLCVMGARRISKDLLNSSKLYTYEGVIEIGNAKVGDRIYGRDGNLTTILDVSPQGVRPVYKMTLQDGRELFCGLDHNWIVIEKATRKIKGTRNNEHYYREVVKTTKELIDCGVRKPRIHNGYKDGETHNIHETRFWIPNNSPVNYPEQDLPIDPYIVGLHAGDGTTKSPNITTMDQEVVDAIYKHADELGLSIRISEKKEKNKAKTYCFTSKKHGGRDHRKNVFMNYLNDFGLKEGKYIPDIYKRSSFDQRLALLQGFLDADGGVSARGVISFSVTNKRLFDDIYELCRSLGINLSKVEGRAKLYGKDCGPVYSSRLFTDLPVFRLKRKLDRMRVGVKTRQPKINKTGIVNIEYVFDAETTCIMVDNEGHDFLTDYYTVTHNSTFMTSYLAHGATFDEGSQNIIAASNADDIKLLTAKIDKGLNHLPEYYQWQRIEDNWGKQVTLGFKDKSNKRYPFSYIMMRNLDNGNNKEAIAGTKPRKLIWDEIGKSSMKEAFQAAIPGFSTPYGWTCSPILVGTGGDMDNFLDAKELFTSPEAYNFLEFPHATKEKVTHGLFLGAKYRLEGKEPTTFAEFIGKPNSKELKNIPMQVSNEEKALEITRKDLETRRLAGDASAYMKEKMYFPIEAEDVFVSGNSNMFNAEAIKNQIQFIKDKGIKGRYVEMVHDGVTIKAKSSDKKPITDFPTPKNADLDAPIVMWEDAISDSKFALYVAGHDSYQKDGQTIHSDSLGALYIYKRIYSLSGDGFQDMLVASYVARPESKTYFNEQCRYLIKYYNAYTLAENNEISFIDYMKSKNDAIKYLAPQPNWLKAITPFTTQNQSFGVSRTALKVQTFLEEITSNYIDEVIDQTKDKENSVISETIGVSRIYDIPLLQELLTYERGKNADRYVAFSLALAQAHTLDPVLNPEKKKDKDSMIKTITDNIKKPSVFNHTKNTFIKKRKR